MSGRPAKYIQKKGRNVTLSWNEGRAAFAARVPSFLRRLRLASGLVLFTYVFLHFINHSLGNLPGGLV